MISCFVFKQKTAYEMRISDWSSDVCSSDLLGLMARFEALPQHRERELRMQINGRSYPFGDFTGLKPFDYIAFVPQWDLLDLLADEARRYPNFRLLMNAEAKHLLRDAEDRVIGVAAMSEQGELRIRADLVVARSEERREGKECVSPWRSRGAPDN